MTTYISILRGINVSGQKKVPMKELLALYESLGFSDLHTYIQSGNVVFKSAEKKPEALVRQIEEKIKGHFGFEVPVIIRTVEELKKIRASNPFLKEPGIEEDKLHVTFLDQLPQQPQVDKLMTYDFSPDRFILRGLEVYVYCPNGYGRTKIHNNFFEGKLKTGATTRNWKTVNTLVEMASGSIGK